MGRKSAKSLAKKQLKKEEKARIAEGSAKVNAANNLEDPMDLVQPFRKFERNGLKLKIDFSRVTDMDTELIDWVFQLTKKNMQSLYEATVWGWNDKDKRTELTEDKALYLIARGQDDNKPVAFVHFRFDMECDDEVLYCYELQVLDDCRRKGLGKFLLQILELLAYKTEMLKVMLTTFKSNSTAQNFFKNAMKYEEDETSPQDPLFEEGYCYEILSKAIKPKPTAKVAPLKKVDEPMQTSPVKAPSA